MGSIALVLMTLWVLIQGFRIVTGRSRDSMAALATDMARAALIVTVATSMALQQGGMGLILTTLILTTLPMAAMFFQGTLGSFMAYSQIGGSLGAASPGPQGQPPGSHGGGGGVFTPSAPSAEGAGYLPAALVLTASAETRRRMLVNAGQLTSSEIEVFYAYPRHSSGPAAANRFRCHIRLRGGWLPAGHVSNRWTGRSGLCAHSWCSRRRGKWLFVQPPSAATTFR